MHKIYILLLASLFVNISVSNASNAIDSVGVENNKGKKVIIYKVEAKETYYSIAKKYNVSYKDVMEFNDSQFLQIGVTLKIPTNLPFAEAMTNKATAVSTPNSSVVTYTIKAKDNLNLLAEKFGTTVDEIKSLNQLNSINLQIGQVLKIPAGKETTASVTTPTIAPVETVAQKPVVVQKSEPTQKPEARTTRTIMTTKSVVKNVTVKHTVKSGDNLGSIAEKYDTTVDRLKSQNNLKSTNLKIGQVLKMTTKKTVKVQVPVTVSDSNTSIAANENEESSNAGATENQVVHTVLAGETIFAIARKYSTTTYQITTANNLANNNLVVGQKLVIKNAAPVAVNEVAESTSGVTLKDPSFKGPASKYGLTQVEEKGAAIWIVDEDLDSTKMFILHRTAPVGTIIKVTNPMTNRSTFAKVVGKFTENESTKDVIIVITKAVADAVGALDKRFFCNLSYGAVDNEQP